MPLITISDQLTLIRSTCNSIEREMRNHQYGSVEEFFKAIQRYAAEGAEHVAAMKGNDDGTPAERAP